VSEGGAARLSVVSRQSSVVSRRFAYTRRRRLAAGAESGSRCAGHSSRGPATAPVGRPQPPWAGHSTRGPATASVGRPQHPWAGYRAGRLCADWRGKGSRRGPAWRRRLRDSWHNLALDIRVHRRYSCVCWRKGLMVGRAGLSKWPPREPTG